MTPDRLRDMTFQRVADWSDARLGLGCFTLARCILWLSATCLATCSLTRNAREGTADSLLNVYFTLCVCAGLLAATGLIAWFEGACADGIRPATIPPLRHWFAVTVAFCFLASSMAMGVAVVAIMARVVAAVGLGDAAARWFLADSVSILGALSWPAGVLFATCAWKRLRRAKQPRRSHATGHVPTVA